MKLNPPHFINAGINTDSFITGYKGNGSRNVRYLKIDSDDHFNRFYENGAIIGKGTFGTVYAVTDTKTEAVWASKVIAKTNLSSSSMRALEREILILKMLDHPHIIMLREIFETSAKFYLIFEKCNSDLMRFTKKKLISEVETKRIIRDIASAVTYLHKRDIVHRDLKLENILITNNPNDADDELFIKLSDFGLSIVKSGRNYTDMLHDRCGTLSYMAPEIFQNGSYSHQCDIWALGIIMYHLLTNVKPFVAHRENDLIENICNHQPNFEISKSAECIDLLKKILNKDPAQRITAAEIRMHPWIAGTSLRESSQTHNVIDMMRLWNKDLRLPTVVEHDAALNVGTLTCKEDRRKALPMNVQNVMFDRAASLRGKGKKGHPAQSGKPLIEGKRLER